MCKLNKVIIFLSLFLAFSIKAMQPQELSEKFGPDRDKKEVLEVIDGFIACMESLPAGAKFDKLVTAIKKHRTFINKQTNPWIICERFIPLSSALIDITSATKTSYRLEKISKEQYSVMLPLLGQAIVLQKAFKSLLKIHAKRQSHLPLIEALLLLQLLNTPDNSDK